MVGLFTKGNETDTNNKRKRHRRDSSCCANNVCAVIACHAVGLGPKDCNKLMGVLGIRQSYNSQWFTTVENSIGKIIWKLLEDILDENLLEEIKFTMTKKHKL